MFLSYKLHSTSINLASPISLIRFSNRNDFLFCYWKLFDVYYKKISSTGLQKANIREQQPILSIASLTIKCSGDDNYGSLYPLLWRWVRADDGICPYDMSAY